MRRDSIAGWILIVLLTVTLGSCGVGIVHWKMGVDARRDAWIAAHQCKAAGYVGGDVWSAPWRLYRCDDGNVYVWSDIPTE